MYYKRIAYKRIGEKKKKKKRIAYGLCLYNGSSTDVNSRVGTASSFGALEFAHPRFL